MSIDTKLDTIIKQLGRIEELLKERNKIAAEKETRLKSREIRLLAKEQRMQNGGK